MRLPRLRREGAQSRPRRSVRIAAACLLVLGLALMAINLVGLGQSYSTPPGAWHPRVRPAERPLLHRSLMPARGESDPAYFARLARQIHLRMVFIFSPVADRVALHDNWLLHLAGYLSGTYRHYEFTEAERGLRRGFGVCTQYSDIATDVLSRGGYSARNVLYPHHTFVAVRSRSGREYVLDPTWGLVIPRSLAAVRAHPDLVRPYYARVPAWDSPIRTGGQRFGSLVARVLRGPPLAINSGTVTPHTAVIEPIAYVLKWAIPALALLLGTGLLLWSRSSRRRPRSGAGEAGLVRAGTH